MRVHRAASGAVSDPQAAAVPRQDAPDTGDLAALAPGRRCVTLHSHGVLPRPEVSRFVQVRTARPAENSLHGCGASTRSTTTSWSETMETSMVKACECVNCPGAGCTC